MGMGFSGMLLSKALLDQGSTKHRKRKFRAGEVLFHEGDDSDGLYVLLSGQLKVYAANPNGREILYSLLAPGEILGELSLDGGTRSATVKAVTDGECLMLKTSTARDLIRSNPAFADYILSKLIARARHSTERLRSIALDGVPERVIALLEATAIVDGDLRRVPCTLTQQEIADRIGASREMVHKVLGELLRAGYIQKDARHRMTILQPLPKGQR